MKSAIHQMKPTTLASSRATTPCRLEGLSPLAAWIALLVGIPTIAAAAPPEVIHSPVGEVAGDEFGSSVTGVGDVNGDGYGDYAVGAYLNDEVGSNAGRVYVYFGGPDADDTADLTLSGTTSGEFFGASVSGAGDMNGDGFDDILVGAWGIDTNGTDAGGAYVFYGGPAADTVADITILGDAMEDYLGASVAGIGDFDGDGYDDIVVGSTKSDHFDFNWGAAFVYLGGTGADGVADLALGGYSGFFGISASSAGDVNGDGYSDVIVGARYYGGGNAGGAFVFHGSAAPDNVADLILNGQSGEWFGTSVSGGGDLNGDGYDDLVVGAQNSDIDGTLAGRVYAFYGGPGADGIADITFPGRTGEQLGTSVSLAGDVNGDGFDDILGGAPTGTGTVYLYHGGAVADSIPDAVLYGRNVDDKFGAAVSGTGDFTGNGLHEFIVGAENNDDAGLEAGRAYVYAADNFEILEPNGGEQWVVGQLGTVRWRGVTTVDLSLSLDGGMTWSTWAGVTGTAEENVTTLVAPAATDVALVRVSAPGQSPMQSNSDVSDAVFRIVAPVDPPAATTVLSTLTGAPENEAFGIEVSSCGDFNDDGHPDMLVSALIANVVGTQEGKAYLFFGGPDRDTTPDLVFAGSNDNGRLGRSVSHADINGDGIDDAILGANWDNTVDTRAGRVEVFFGSAAPDATADVIYPGESALDEFGTGVAGVGDVNGDGFGDFIASAPYSDYGASNTGRVYLHYGSFWTNTTADLVFTGETASGNLGIDLAGAGDVNADGYDDIILGTSKEIAYVYFGGPDADEVADLTLAEGSTNDRFGRTVGGGHDINGDGFDDFVIGASGNDTGGSDAGRIFVYFGGPGVDEQPDAYLTGTYPNQGVGEEVAVLGDVNGDGFADIASGSPNNPTYGDETGQVFVFFGSPAPDSTPGVVLSTTTESEFLGTALAAAGDVNGDGFADLLVGTELERAHVHDFRRYHLTRPTEGQNWNVGATETIRWSGAEPANVWLSSDGGNSYELLESGVGGQASNEISILVPHRPGRFSRIKLTPSALDVSGSATSDSLFTIDASVALDLFQAAPPEENRSGMLLQWKTTPGPESLRGYRIESKEESSGWQTLTSLTSETRFLDPFGAPTTRYRLTAINGLGDTFVLGEVGNQVLVALGAWPQPYRGGDLRILYAAAGGLGGTASPTRVTLHDLAGRLIREIVDGPHSAGQYETIWDGKNREGRSLPAGVYFLRSVSAGQESSTKLTVIR